MSSFALGKTKLSLTPVQAWSSRIPVFLKLFPFQLSCFNIKTFRTEARNHVKTLLSLRSETLDPEEKVDNIISDGSLHSTL